MKVKVRDCGDNIKIKFISTFNGTVSSWEDILSRGSATAVLDTLHSVIHGKVDSADLDLPELGA